MSMCFKTDAMREEFARAPTLLQQLACDFERLSEQEGIIPVMTRVREALPGSSGVHEDGRAVDFRDESPKGSFLYEHEQRERILSELNRKYARRDGKPSALWHSFRGGMHHFHLQVAAVMGMYYNRNVLIHRCPNCGHELNGG